MDRRDQERQEIERNGGRGDDLLPLPTEAMKDIEQDIQEADGKYEEAPEYEGSVGRTMFDTPYSEDGTVTVLMPKENIEDVLPPTARRYYLGTSVFWVPPAAVSPPPSRVRLCSTRRLVRPWCSSTPRANTLPSTSLRMTSR